MSALRNDIYLGMGAIIAAVNPDIPVIVRGTEMPSLEKSDEWLMFEMLGWIPNPSRRAQVQASAMFQLTCYAIESEYRQGQVKKFNRHYELGDIYHAIFNQQDYLIKNSCIRFLECKIAYLDLKTSTFTAKSISTGTTPQLQTQSAVLLTDALIIEHTD